MAQKDWPQATKNSVEKVSKRVDKVEKDAVKAALSIMKLEKRFDAAEADASAGALVAAIRDVAKAIREKTTTTTGLSEADAREVLDGLTAHVNRLTGVGIGPHTRTAQKGENIMAVPTIQEYRDLLAEADNETNRIAQRIADLIASIVPGLSEADANEVKAGLQAEVDKLKGVGVVS